MPPPASGLPARLVLGPALRAQSDRRLVRLVREGYESAFEEIVRRYRRPLDRFAASIVGGRSEDVTQDSFRKALVALRDGEGDLELRPWLYRIVRNTALNDLRDRPPAAAELAEDLVGGGRSAAIEAEQREEVARLKERLLALPSNQRAALVMRELEGMSHEEIATALGVSGGAARQAIARGRATVRSGFGALVPLPLIRGLSGGADGASEAAIGGAGAAAGGAGAAAVGAGGLGAGAAMKLGLATVIVAGSIGAGVAIDHHGGAHRQSDPPQAAAPAPGGPRGDGIKSPPSPVLADDESTGRTPVGAEGQASSGHGRHGDDGGDRRGHGGGPGEGHRRDDGHGRDDRGRDDGGRFAVPTESVTAESDPERHGGKGGDDRGSSAGGGDDGDNSGRGSTSGHRGSSSGKSGDGGSRGGSGQGGGGQGRTQGGSGSSGSTRGRHGSDDVPAEVLGTVPAESSTSGGSGGTGSSGSSGGSGSSSGDSGSGGGESSGGSGSSDGGSESTTASPSTSGSGSSGGPSTSSLGSTGSSTDASHTDGGSGSSSASEISP
jgi:RNA polymerase sigma factor (sigma-70 family)